MLNVRINLKSEKENLYLFSSISPPEKTNLYCIVKNRQIILIIVPLHSNYCFAMHIDIISVLPELLSSPLNHSIIKRAQQKGLVEIHLHHLRDYTTDKHRTVDDYAFGPDAGMVMKIEPIYKIISKLKAERDYDEIIYTSPDGELLNQPIANQVSTYKNIIILCGHYKGIDHRVREHLVTREISIGDYVLSGGELAAAVIVDSVVRLVPGVLSDETSALTDSFQDNLLAPPIYTRPANFNGWEVPKVLTSGNFKEIEKWQLEQSIERTRKLRPNLLDNNNLD